MAAICDIFDIHELAELAGGSSFLLYWKLRFSLSFNIYDRLFVIYDIFSNTSYKFQIFVMTFYRMSLLVIFN